MDFEIGDKVLTVTGLYMGGEWRERGVKGKVVDKSEEYGGLLTVKFKGLEELRFLRPDYLILRKKAEVKAPEELDAPERERPFEEGDSVVFTKDVTTGGLTVEVTEGIWAEVVENIPNSNFVVVAFDDGGTLTVAEEVLASEEETFGEAPDVPDYWNPADQFDDESIGQTNPEVTPDVADALQQILDRIEEIKGLLTQGPRTEFVVNVHPSAGLDEEAVAAALKQQKEEPAPEPVFKKAKEVKIGDLLYTEGGAYDKVDRTDTKTSGYTSLYGTFGNRIAQVPSGRVVQVLEEVS